MPSTTHYNLNVFLQFLLRLFEWPKCSLIPISTKWQKKEIKHFAFKGSINQILQPFYLNKAKLRTKEMSNLLEMYITFKLRKPETLKVIILHSQLLNSDKYFYTSWFILSNENSCHIIKKLFRKTARRKGKGGKGTKKNFLFFTFLRLYK